jgi:spore coat protein U-like protein
MHKNRVTRRHHIGVVLASFAALMGPNSAFALLQSCNVSATAVNFVTYNPLSGSPNDATGTITVSCQVLVIGVFVSWTIALNSGSSGNYGARQMQSGTDSLSYNLYTSAARSSVWGDGTGGTSVVSANPFLLVGSNTVDYTVYGRVPAGQDRAAGIYMDPITVTVTY